MEQQVQRSIACLQSKGTSGIAGRARRGVATSASERFATGRWTRCPLIPDEPSLTIAVDR